MPKSIKEKFIVPSTASITLNLSEVRVLRLMLEEAMSGIVVPDQAQVIFTPEGKFEGIELEDIKTGQRVSRTLIKKLNDAAIEMTA